MLSPQRKEGGFNLYHSITFGDKNTWDDWHLIPTSRPLFNPPNVKTQYVDIPGSYGTLDLSESLTGYPLFENREGSNEFIVHNGYWDWSTAYSTIMNYLHGQTMRAILEDDKDFYYEGRFAVNEWKSDEHWSIITIDYNVYPFKKEMFSGIEDWLWDPFNFETGIIRNYKNLEVDGTLNVVIGARNEFVTPIIKATITGGNSLSVLFDGETYELKNGDNVIPEIIIGNVEKTLTFTGNGTVNIDYRGGSL